MPHRSTRFDAVLFDLDGVVTDTAKVHAAAWKRLFDEFLSARSAATGESFGSFDLELDYHRYVDGKPRYKGVQSFLEARGIALPWGDPADDPDRETVCGLGNRKNRYFVEELGRKGVEVYPDVVDLIRTLQRRELVKMALVSSSKNAADVLEAAGLVDLFTVRVDGVDGEQLGLAGKPTPDMFLEAARRLGVEPRRTVVVEDALAGVEAGRRGGFGRVVALDRANQAELLRRAGAHVVLHELNMEDLLDLREEPESFLPGGWLDAPPPFRGAEGRTQWSLQYEGFVPEEQGTREALLTLGNGYFASRGALSEARADGVSYPGTYLAGGYSRFTKTVDGRLFEGEDLVNVPNWLWLDVATDGTRLEMSQVELLEHRQELDLRRGLLARHTRWRDAAGHTTALTEHRLVSMDAPHLAATESTIVAEDWSGQLALTTGIDGRVINSGAAPHHDGGVSHLVPRGHGTDDHDTVWLKVETKQSELRVALALRARLYTEDREVEDIREDVSGEDQAAQRLRVMVSKGRPVTLERVMAIYSSRDRAISEPALEARTAVRRAGTFSELLRAHALAWAQLWGRFDIVLDEQHPDPQRPAELLLRLHVFHLVQTLSLHSLDLDVGVPARGWHGEAYQGHVFWDELFVFPFFNLRVPEISRALLLYRYRRLNEARARAREAGLRGALFPWQSGSNGREETPALYYNPILQQWFTEHTMLQCHVSAAVAYNVWQYYQATLDREFMAFYGAELFLDVARMWASTVTYNETLDRYEIRGIMGPDEYHHAYPGSDKPGIDNNAYTNVLAAWVLWRAREVLETLPAERRRELYDRLALDEAELEHWDTVSRKLRVCFFDDGLISQFEGYEQLPELDLESFAREHGGLFRIHRVLEARGESPGDYRISKQADVLMLFYLFSMAELQEIFERLGYPFDETTIPKNVDYYLRRTTHGSTLSRVAHSWVLARVDREHSWRLFVEALQSDIADIQGGTTREGIHLGAMGGTLDLVQRCYTGFESRDGVLWLSPRLPYELEAAEMYLHYRGQSLLLRITRGRLVVRSTESSAQPLKIGIHNRIHEIAPGQTVELTFRAERRRTRSDVAGAARA